MRRGYSRTDIWGREGILCGADTVSEKVLIASDGDEGMTVAPLRLGPGSDSLKIFLGTTVLGRHGFLRGVNSLAGVDSTGRDGDGEGEGGMAAVGLPTPGPRSRD